MMAYDVLFLHPCGTPGRSYGFLASPSCGHCGLLESEAADGKEERRKERMERERREERRKKEKVLKKQTIKMEIS